MAGAGGEPIRLLCLQISVSVAPAICLTIFGEVSDAAVREVLEETGIEVELVGERREDIEDPAQLHRPIGVQLEYIEPGHEHIDLIYLARPTGSSTIRTEFEEDKVGWYAPGEWDSMGVNAEVRGWCERALSTLDGA